MRTPRIIAVNRYYAPDHSATAKLLSELAEMLVRDGHPVIVVTSRQRYDDAKADLPAREAVNGVTVRRVWTSRFGRAGLVGRSVDYLTFYVSAFLALVQETGVGDTILAKTDPPLISIPAAIAVRMRRARLVNWCQDLFPETAAALGLGWARGRLGRMLTALRNWSLRQAATNVALCEEMRQHLADQGVNAARLQIIHNWPDAAITPLPRRDGKPFTIAYSGNLGRAHDVNAIITLVRCTANLPGLAWLFIGGGAGFARLRQEAAARAFGNVTFEPYAAHSELAQSLARGNLHLVSLDSGCEGLIMPSKLYGIMAAGRPTLFLGDPEGAVPRILRAHDAGITLDSARPETFAPMIRSLMEDPVRLATMGQKARAAFDRHYSASQSLAAWQDILARAAVRPSFGLHEIAS